MGLAYLIFALLLLSATGGHAVIPIKDVEKHAARPFVENRYIVELETISIDGFQPKTAHKRFYDSLESREVTFDVSKEFDSPGIFIGVSLTLKDPDVQ
ncbi:hypothetical protein E1B28_000320 [Marasmius oreades]|uniref:Uncharacterized protein n=1 Tax=Marasmius oreades TaxID=181124 RepID=A0A9P7V177_9AGAR|nr:uncharacterized protein E1B28_000320 [Marasmius oreades]KAG7098362.1 hypothetical protein E1B28_000320 [Marasmius oreades]